MKCKTCSREVHHCSSCGYDDFLDIGYCNEKCFIGSEEYAKEKASFEAILDRLSEDSIRCVRYLLSEYNSNYRNEYTKWVDNYNK